MAVLPIGIGAEEEGGYQIERSLRFNSADSAQLSRSFGTPTDNKMWTMSTWIKRGKLTADYYTLFGRFVDGDNFMRVDFLDDTFRIYQYQSATKILLKSTQVLRDTSAWYHLMVVVDIANATSANKVKLYVNGTQVTSFSTSTYPETSDTSIWNVSGGASHLLGGLALGEFDGYMAEAHFIDGSALDPTSFGEFNSDTGVWQPIAYTGSYGTNGFYLDFADNSSTTALGYDAAGSNDWTLNNFSVTAGAGNDSLVDVPTPYGTDTGVGGEVRGNYCTLNPLQSPIAPTNGNLTVTGVGAHRNTLSTIYLPNVPVYIEAYPSTAQRFAFGIATASLTLTSIAVSQAAQKGMYSDSGGSGGIYDGTTLLYGGLPAITGTDVWQLALDTTTGKGWLGLNNVWYDSSGGTTGNPSTGANPTWTGITSAYSTMLGTYDGVASNINFGQRPFSYTAPSGFKALCTQNLPEPTVVDGSQYFNTIVWNGDTTSSQAITGVGFQPDLVWAKSTDANSGQDWVDAVRGATKNIQSHNTLQESTSNTVISFQSDGFTVGDGLGYDINKSGEVVIGRCWKANGAGVANGDGTIPSTVSANTTAGFSIVKTTGTGSAGTIGHGLGVAPRFIFGRNYSDAGGSNWPVYHASVGANNIGWINLLNGFTTSSATAYWNDTAPTTSVFSVGTNSNTNQIDASHIFYCFAPVDGYSAFGSYSGATTKVFVYLGFRPAFVLLKKSSEASTTYGWPVVDNLRPPTTVGKEGYNPTLELWTDQSVAEATSSSYGIDLLSNGFCINEANNTNVSGSGKTYIYAAFAENPFKYSLAR